VETGRRTSVKENLKLRATGLGWLAVWRLARALPERRAAQLFEAFGERAYRRNERRRAIVRENLSAVVGHDRLEETVREAFRLYGRYWVETFRMEDLSDEELEDRFSHEGTEQITEACASGLGPVLATPHLGNWDAGGRWVAKNWGLTVVVEVLRPRMLFDRFVRHRSRLGMKIVPLVRGGEATAQCLTTLKSGHPVALVSDRDLSGTGIEVKMFGRRTKLPPGPAVLALRSGAPLLPACIYQRELGRWHAVVLPDICGDIDREAPDAVQRLTQRLAESFEGLITPHPAQWRCFARYWLE
jgi:phosphatidylinositol dimannoside acyltransferase